MTEQAETSPALLTERERNVIAYALLHYANALDAEDAAQGGYDGPLETPEECRSLSDKVRGLSGG